VRERTRRRAPGEDVTATIASPAPSPPDVAAARELAQRLREALAELPPAQAEIFCLHCLQGWSYADIACAHGMTVDAVGVSLHRARRRLRERLKNVAQLKHDEVSS
jgi:RNA polymerase sigma-70 factor (ECF subfamily)